MVLEVKRLFPFLDGAPFASAERVAWVNPERSRLTGILWKPYYLSPEFYKY